MYAMVFGLNQESLRQHNSTMSPQRVPVQPATFVVKNPQWWIWGLFMHYKFPALRRVLETVAGGNDR